MCVVQRERERENKLPLERLCDDASLNEFYLSVAQSV